MTIALGIHFGNHILLAADTRITFYDSSGRVVRYKDDSKKITKTKMGLITGAGYAYLLDAVDARLAKKEVHNTDEILAIFGEECSNFDSKLIERTRWIFTYISPKSKEINLRLALYDPSVGHKIGIFEEENKVLLIPPFEASEEVSQELVDFLNKNIKSLNKFGAFSESISYHSALIGSLIKLIQPAFPSISHAMQIGIHSIEGAGVSSLIDLKKEDSYQIKLSLD